MQVINRVDVAFSAFYSALILLVGAAFVLGSGNLLFIPVTLVVLALYFYFGMGRVFRRLRAISQPMPPEWKQVLLDYSLYYHRLDDEARKRFEDDIRIFLSDFTVEGRQRQQVDMRSKLLIAAGFATVLNGRPDWEPPIKDGVLVFPGVTFNRDYETGRGMRAGQAMVNAPLIVTRHSLDESFAHPGDGNNVIYHELAHYFDFEDGVAEGTPAARMEPEKARHWQQLIKEEWRRASQGRSFLRDYAATNEAETFAVAAEVFFETPHVMYNHNPQLYEAMKEFFNLDPLEIFNRRPPIQ